MSASGRIETPGANIGFLRKDRFATNQGAARQPATMPPHFARRRSDIIGASFAMQRVLEEVDRVATTELPVLVTGETGTGKGLIATALHAASARAVQPLIKVPCGALVTGLVESELFGHERGAFTGALHKRTGRFAEADGGTIFLDEIGELSPQAQASLLQVLEDGEYCVVGSNATRFTDARVIAATNVDIFGATRSGAFRADLYYRLSVVPIHLPSLRDRRDDIPLLAAHFLLEVGQRIGRRFEGIAPDALDRLMGHDWPGNVRELRNVIERAALLSRSRRLAVGMEMLASAPDATDSSDALEDVERQHILRVLARTSWRIGGSKGAARLLRINPSTLRSRMKKLGIGRNARR